MPTDHTPEPPLFLTWPILARMRAIEGWLDEEEADLLIAAVLRAVSAPQAARAIVEVGSYCGRSTVVLGSVLQSLRLPDARVYAIDPHDGRVGALDRGSNNCRPVWTNSSATSRRQAWKASSNRSAVTRSRSTGTSRFVFCSSTGFTTT